MTRAGVRDEGRGAPAAACKRRFAGPRAPAKAAMTGPERHREPRTERRERPHAGSAFGNGVMRSALKSSRTVCQGGPVRRRGRWVDRDLAGAAHGRRSNTDPHVVTERPQPLARAHVPRRKLVWARPADDFPEAARTIATRRRPSRDFSRSKTATWCRRAPSRTVLC